MPPMQPTRPNPVQGHTQPNPVPLTNTAICVSCLSVCVSVWQTEEMEVDNPLYMEPSLTTSSTLAVSSQVQDGSHWLVNQSTCHAHFSDVVICATPIHPPTSPSCEHVTCQSQNHPIMLHSHMAAIRSCSNLIWFSVCWRSCLTVRVVWYARMKGSSNESWH